MHCTGSLYRKSSAPADGNRWDAALRFAGLAMPRRKAAQVDAVEYRKAAGSAGLPMAYHVVWCGVWTAQRQQSQLFRALALILLASTN